jgi:hypothetical protein
MNKNQFRNMTWEMLSFFAQHAGERLDELYERKAPVEFIDRLEQDINDIMAAMHAKTNEKK